MLWVKGELLTEIDAAGVDPTGQLERKAQPGLFDRRDWFRRVARHGSGIPVIARAASEGALAWLFLQRVSESRVTSLSNWYSFAFRPVFSGKPDEARKRAMLIAMAKRLRAARPRIASLSLDPVPQEDVELLEQTLRRAGWSVFAGPCSTSWIAEVSDVTFEDYWAARPGELRSTFKRKASKVDFACEVLTRFDKRAWGAYEAIYSQSWKPDEGAPSFLRELAEEEGAKGNLRLGICRIAGEPVAAQFWTVEKSRALIHKLAYTESAREHSPGTLLSEAMFRHVIDVDKVKTIDFGTGDDGYKAAWMDESAPLFRIEAFNPSTVAGSLGGLRKRAGRLVRKPVSG